MEGKADVPKKINAEPFDFGSWVFMLLVFGIVILWCIGAAVEYTKLFDKNSGHQNSDQPVKVEDRKSKLGLFFYSWSPINNLSKLFTVKQDGDKTLEVLNGVRVLSICYVVVGHGFSFIQFTPIANTSTIADITKESLFGIVPGGFYAVDAFFFLSGFLSFYIMTTKMYPRKGYVNFLLLYFHRYYRLIFPIIFLTMFGSLFFKYLGDGPIYKRNSEAFFSNCEKYWWTNMLFINNYYPFYMADQCIGWVWYLANDFQFYLMTPFVIFVYCRYRKLGYACCFTLIAICMMINGILTAKYDISPANNSENLAATTFLYERAPGRMGAYFVGGIFGLSYFELSTCTKFPELQHTIPNYIYHQLKHSRLLSVFSLLIGVTLTSLYVFPLGDYFKKCAMGSTTNCWSKTSSVLYNTTARPFFVLGLGLAIAPTFVGRLRVVRGFLAAEMFTVIARLNYMVYMIHCFILFWILNDTRQAYYVNWVNQWYFSIGCIVLSIIFAVPFTLICEAPFMNIEKLLLFPSSKPQNKNVRVFYFSSNFRDTL